jgi:glycosyltransferase involved in cell wall biosynthesis
MRAALLESFPRLDPARVFAVPNGYDPDDFPESLPTPPRDRFVVTYAGTVFALTSARGLLGAVRLLHQRAPRLAEAMSVRFLGRIVETELPAFAGVPGVERVGYVAHDEVLGRLAASHLTVCILDDVAGADRIYPAKIFELMRLGRPVLVLAPRPSALARLVEHHRLGPVVHPRDEAAIASVLEDALCAFRRGDEDGYTWRNAPNVTRYDRRALAGEFAEILREAAARTRRPGS